MDYKHFNDFLVPPDARYNKDEDKKFLLAIPKIATFYTDVAKRKTRCRICRDNIVKGEERVGITNVGIFQNHRGQTYWKRNNYVHPQCLLDAFKGVKIKKRKDACSRCGREQWKKNLHKIEGGYLRDTGICEDCVISGKYRETKFWKDLDAWGAAVEQAEAQAVFKELQSEMDEV